MKIELIGKRTFNYDACSYSIIKAIEDSSITILVIDNNSRNKRYSIIAKCFYDNIGYEFESPYLSWNNYVFYSNHFGVVPNDEMMNCSVQNGEKLAATLRIGNKDDYIKIKQGLPDTVRMAPYGKPSENVPYLCRDGRLLDYFTFEEIKQVYDAHHVYSNGNGLIDWERLERLFYKDLLFFSDEGNSNISTQSASGDDMIIIGLLFGYPIESTIAYFKGNKKVNSPFAIKNAKEAFNKGEHEYYYHGDRYTLHNGIVVADWQDYEAYCRKNEG